MQEKNTIDKNKLGWLESEWDRRSSFTLSELGVGNWARGVIRAITRNGELLTWTNLEELVDEALDGAIIGWYELGEFDASQILKHCDPGMYTRAYTEEVDHLVKDGTIRLLVSDAE